MRLKLTFVYLSCFLCLANFCTATTAVTGHVSTLGTTAVTSSTFVRFWLRGCGGNQPRINGTSIIAPSQGGTYFMDFPVNASGNVSGTLYSTRDSLGTGNGDIECGGSQTSVWYGMVVFNSGKAGPETPVHAKSSGTIDVSNVTPITTSPVVNSPTGDSTYARLDGGNQPFTGAVQMNNNFTALVGQNSAKLYNLNNVLFVDGVKYAQTGAGLTAAINDCLALASCPGVVAPYIPSSTVSSTLTFTRAITLWLGQVNLTLAGSPGIAVNAAATGMIINGSGAGVSVLSCTAASTDCLRWLASSGVAQDFTLTVTTNTTHGLTLDASLAGQDIKFNNFKHLTMTAPSTNTADGIHALAVDSTHKISFNHFENFNIVDFLNAQHFTTTGTVGPTDNLTIGGQFRQTVLRGSGVLLDAASQDNTWVGGNLSFYTTGINLAAVATVTGNKFYGTVPESNTNGWSIGAAAADNELRGVPCGSQACTDAGTRTIIDDGNNAIGPGGSAVQKQGAPFQSLTLISASGFPVTLTNSAGAPLTANVILSMASGTATVDLASVASAACTADSADVTLTGAAVGDPVRVAAATALPAGVWLIGRVTATNTGRFQLCNLSGGAVDRASDTYTISVVK